MVRIGWTSNRREVNKMGFWHCNCIVVFDKNKEKLLFCKRAKNRNGLFLNEDVVSENKWTIEKIKDRTDKIVRILLKMYSW